jgi:L-ribulose-5-phosphate 4-epimerase
VEEREGVIKFGIQFTEAQPMPYVKLKEINAWRKILHLMGLIGRDPGRYGGFGYGNISQRLDSSEFSGHQTPFVISGTQTGGLSDLTEAHYTAVLACYPERNLVLAQGPVLPSSEALVHGMLYAMDPGLRFAMHVHSPAIWRSARALRIPITREGIPYGTVEMAEEVRRLFLDTSLRRRGIFAMGGHEDGIVSFGQSAEKAGCILLKALAAGLRR